MGRATARVGTRRYGRSQFSLANARGPRGGRGGAGGSGG